VEQLRFRVFSVVIFKTYGSSRKKYILPARAGFKTLTAEKIRKMKLLVDSPRPPIGAILGQRLSTEFQFILHEFQLIDHPDHAYFAVHLRTLLAGNWLTKSRNVLALHIGRQLARK